MISEVLVIIRMPPNVSDKNMRIWWQLICCLAATGTVFLWPIVPALAQSEDCRFLVSPQEFNTFESVDDRIVIGRVSDRPYIVLLTHDLQENLPELRACVPDAFLTSSRLGRYVHIASFNNYREAKELSNFINDSLGIDVRIIHASRLDR